MFILQKRKLKGSLFLFVGMLIVIFLRRPFIGLIVEVVGAFYLLSDTLPVIIDFAKTLPVVGILLSIPPISTLVDSLRGGPRLPI